MGRMGIPGESHERLTREADVRGAKKPGCLDLNYRSLVCRWGIRPRNGQCIEGASCH